VIGASADSIEQNQKFTDKESYTFPLWCDTELKLIKALGIEIAGRKLPQRVTFVVAADGTIAKIYDKVTPKGHADDVLKAVKELAAKR
jgi:thioredoxin-dependent peroxiredoxin